MDQPELLANKIQKPELKTTTFFSDHFHDYQDLFYVLDIEMPDSLESAVRITQPWVRGDHSRPVQKFKHFTDAEVAKLLEIYNRLDMVAERPLPKGHYDDIVVLGATQVGNNRRIQFLRKSIDSGQVTTDRIMLLGGQRRAFEEVEKDVLEDNLETITKRGVGDSWIEQLRTRNISDLWETDLMRVAAITCLGSMALHQLHLRIANQETVEAYHFNWRNIPIVLQHTLAVERNGAPRHTTEACIQDWLESYKPPTGARVAFIGAQPHLDRMGLSAKYVLRQSGRNDIQLEIGGSSVANVTPAFYLGEVARRLYEEQRISS